MSRDDLEEDLRQQGVMPNCRSLCATTIVEQALRVLKKKMQREGVFGGII